MAILNGALPSQDQILEDVYNRVFTNELDGVTYTDTTGGNSLPTKNTLSEALWFLTALSGKAGNNLYAAGTAGNGYLGHYLKTQYIVIGGSEKVELVLGNAHTDDRVEDELRRYKAWNFAKALIDHRLLEKSDSMTESMNVDFIVTPLILWSLSRVAEEEYGSEKSESGGYDSEGYDSEEYEIDTMLLTDSLYPFILQSVYRDKSTNLMLVPTESEESVNRLGDCPEVIEVSANTINSKNIKTKDKTKPISKPKKQKSEKRKPEVDLGLNWKSADVFSSDTAIGLLLDTYKKEAPYNVVDNKDSVNSALDSLANVAGTLTMLIATSTEADKDAQLKVDGKLAKDRVITIFKDTALFYINKEDPYNVVHSKDKVSIRRNI